MVAMVYVEEREADRHTLLGNPTSRVSGKSLREVTKMHVEHFALFCTAPGIRRDPLLCVTVGEGEEDGFVDLVWEDEDVPLQ